MTRIFTFFIAIVLSSILFAQTAGTLSVSTSTSSAGGGYAPRNVVAIWVEDGSGNFVKTLLAYAGTRKTHLNTWEASTTAAGSAFNVTDAISGATRTSHAIRSCTWNGKDYTGADMPDGSYTLRMELTDKNSTGNYSSFTFTKGPNVDTQAPINVPSFSSIALNWMPTGVGITEDNANRKIRVFPNPAQSDIFVSGDGIERIEVLSLTGEIVCESCDRKVNIKNLANGIYLMRVYDSSGLVYTTKLFKE